MEKDTAFPQKEMRIGAVEDAGQFCFRNASLQQSFLEQMACRDDMVRKSHRKVFLQES